MSNVHALHAQTYIHANIWMCTAQRLEIFQIPVFSRKIRIHHCIQCSIATYACLQIKSAYCYCYQQFFFMNQWAVAWNFTFIPFWKWMVRWGHHRCHTAGAASTPHRTTRAKARAIHCWKMKVGRWWKVNRLTVYQSAQNETPLRPRFVLKELVQEVDDDETGRVDLGVLGRWYLVLVSHSLDPKT